MRRKGFQPIVQLFLIAIIITGFLFNPRLGHGSNQEIEEIVTGLESSNFWDQKYNYLVELFQKINDSDWEKVENDQQERAKIIFISTLKESSSLLEKGESPDIPKYLELLGGIAGKLKDKRTIPLLIEGLPCNYFVMALVEIGEASLNPLIEALETGSAFKKSGALMVFRQMYKQNKMKSENVGKVKQAVIKSSKDDLLEVRISAVRTLGAIKDKDAISLLENISKEDDESYEIDAFLRGGKKGNKIKIYPVREEAEKVLKELNN